MKPHEKFEAAAFHEAAHAVAALEMGRSVRLIEIGLVRPWFGTAYVDGVTRVCDPGEENDPLEPLPSEPDFSKDSDTSLVIVLAAYPAEVRAVVERLGRSQSTACVHASWAGGSDQVFAAGYAEYASWSMRKAQRVAEGIVDDQWPVIVELAESLLDNDGYLDGPDVLDIVEWSRAAA